MKQRNTSPTGGTPMEKMKLESPDITARNIEKIEALFPNCITETGGRLERMIEVIGG